MPELSTIAIILGFAAFFVTSFGYLNKNDSILKRCIAIAAAVLAVHYFLLFSWVAGISLSVNFIRNQIAVRKSGSRWFFAFALLQITLGILFFSTPYDVLPILGSLISGYALFCTRGIRLRLLMMLCTALWLSLNIILHSWGAALQDSLSLTMNLIGILNILGLIRSKPNVRR